MLILFNHHKNSHYDHSGYSYDVTNSKSAKMRLELTRANAHYPQSSVYTNFSHFVLYVKLTVPQNRTRILHNLRLLVPETKRLPIPPLGRKKRNITVSAPFN